MLLNDESLANARGWLAALRGEMAKAVVGQDAVIDQVLIALLARGHVLIEGVPGLGKTLLVRALSKTLSLHYARVQFTPDLMPSDITGHTVLDPSEKTDSGLGALRFRKGPVFTHLLLADEINRAPAKTQSALLEVMQEYQVTLDGKAVSLSPPFMVLATQNPIDTEGTYPLPEAQLDRFLFKIQIDYPSREEETAIVLRTTSGQSGDQMPLEALQTLAGEQDVLALQQLTAAVRVERQVAEYAVGITRATRQFPGLYAGAGPRGAIALVRAARARALLDGRDFVTPDDVKSQALPALRHRVSLSPDAQLEGRRVDELLLAAVEGVSAPRV